jgi:hypothetical protein
MYYLNIDLDGTPRSDVTSDLVFPVMFGVAPEDVARHIIAQLSSHQFWTEAGLRTSPRTSPTYSPDAGWGLLGGVWVAVTFWYAFAAAPYMPAFMDHALATSFQNYSRDPRRSNTVPGQFSEWLDGETLVNNGMMLSPWFPPRYLWAAIEGVAGLSLEADAASVNPNLAPDWKWMGVQNLPYRGQQLTWFVLRTPEVNMYTNYNFHESAAYLSYEEDISSCIHVAGDSVVALGLRQDDDVMLFVGNTENRSVTTAVTVDADLSGAYRATIFDSLVGRWVEDEERWPAEKLQRGVPIQIEHKGFWALELKQDV